jgi:hypothetical protein
MIYTKTEVMDFLRPVVEANDEIQEFVSEHGEQIPHAMLPLLSKLDWAIRNYGEPVSA